MRVLSSFSFIMNRHCILAALLAGLNLALPAWHPAWADPPPDRIADVVARVQGAVVRIISVQPAGKQSTDNKTGAKAGASDPATTIGSGFVIDPSGLVATNRHVVEGAVSVYVGTPDGGRYRADRIVMAGQVDIALLRIDVDPDHRLPAVTMGDSDTVQVGDSVIAIGDPFGFGGSVSAGIVSATNRNISESPFDDYLQTDAAINHGSSGGPLFNLSGQVIGMTSVLYAPGNYSGSAGVGFAIPARVLNFVLPRLEKNGQIAAGMLPVQTQQVPELMASAIGAPDPGGALVILLTAQGGAMAGKIQPGDVIRSFNGKPVLDPRDLARQAARATVGSRVTLELYRSGQLTTVEVPILPLAGPGAIVRQSPPAKILGLHFAATPGSAKKPGVTVEAVDPSGSVADSGLRKGDVILRVQEQLVFTPEQAFAALQARSKSKAPFAAVLVERDKKQGWMPIALPD